MKKTTKIINDPIYGFIRISNKIILDLINHKYFQRLRRISQLGLSYLVYPGAHHTRFQHAIGSMLVMNASTETLMKSLSGLNFTNFMVNIMLIQ